MTGRRRTSRRESQDETEAKEINIKLTGKPQKKKKGSAVEDGP